MRTRLRLLADSFDLVGHWARETGFGTTGARATLVVRDGVHEFVVGQPPFGDRVASDGIPVYYRAAVTERPPRHRRRLRWVPLRAETPERPPYLVVDADYPDSPRATIVRDHGDTLEIDEIVLVGAGMRVVARDRTESAPTVDELRRGRWSRTIGALQGNASALRRLQRSDFALVGCGRNGALMAGHLAAIGVEGTIALVDDDVVEDHNADAMGLPPDEWSGRRKVDAVAHLVRQQNSAARVRRVARAASHSDAIAAMARADVILGAVDHGEARVVAALAGAAFLRPVLDVGSGIGRDDRGRWRAGCDVRLTVPRRCLVCFGGVERAATARGGDWWRERGGSLRSLNTVATGVGQWLLERLFASRRFDSSWVRVTAEDDGMIATETVRQVPDFSDCPVCRHTARGWGAFEHRP